MERGWDEQKPQPRNGTKRGLNVQGAQKTSSECGQSSVTWSPRTSQLSHHKSGSEDSAKDSAVGVMVDGIGAAVSEAPNPSVSQETRSWPRSPHTSQTTSSASGSSTDTVLTTEVGRSSWLRTESPLTFRERRRDIFSFKRSISRSRSSYVHE